MPSNTDLLVLPSIENIEEIVKNISNVNVTKGHYYSLEFCFKDGKIQILSNGKDIKDFCAVWLSSHWGSKDIAYAVSLYLDHYGTPHTFVEMATSKITDIIGFIYGGIRTPNTYFVNRHTVKNYVETIENTCDYPMVIKDTKGSRGRHSVIVKNREELLRKVSEFPKQKKFLFQQYIPNEYDWGVLVANGEVVSAEKSYHSADEFRNNACNGATEVFVKLEDIPKPIQDMAIRASKSIGLSWARSDIIVDMNTQVPYLLEINRSPGITSGSTEVSGGEQFIRAQLTSLLAEAKE